MFLVVCTMFGGRLRFGSGEGEGPPAQSNFGQIERGGLWGLILSLHFSPQANRGSCPTSPSPLPPDKA